MTHCKVGVTELPWSPNCGVVGPAAPHRPSVACKFHAIKVVWIPPSEHNKIKNMLCMELGQLDLNKTKWWRHSWTALPHACLFVSITAKPCDFVAEISWRNHSSNCETFRFCHGSIARCCNQAALRHASTYAKGNMRRIGKQLWQISMLFSRATCSKHKVISKPT